MGLNWGLRPLGLEVGKVFRKMLESAEQGRSREGGCHEKVVQSPLGRLSPVSWLSLKVKVLVAQSCPTLWDTMGCSPPGSSVHGILQARILGWVAIFSSRRSSPPRDWTWVILDWQADSLLKSPVRTWGKNLVLDAAKL